MSVLLEYASNTLSLSLTHTRARTRAHTHTHSQIEIALILYQASTTCMSKVLETNVSALSILAIWYHLSSLYSCGIYDIIQELLTGLSS